MTMKINFVAEIPNCYGRSDICLHINDRIHILEIKLLKIDSPNTKKNDQDVNQENIEEDQRDIMKKAEELSEKALTQIANKQYFNNQFILSHHNTGCKIKCYGAVALFDPRPKSKTIRWVELRNGNPFDPKQKTKNLLKANDMKEYFVEEEFKN